MKFARWVFWSAGIYGIIVLLPLYFLENKIALSNPPAITHPDFYYGFIGVALAFQILFLVIGSDPVRYRMAILPALVEKFSYVIALAVLHAGHRIPLQSAVPGIPDCILGTLFAISYFRIRNHEKAR